MPSDTIRVHSQKEGFQISSNSSPPSSASKVSVVSSIRVLTSSSGSNQGKCQQYILFWESLGLWSKNYHPKRMCVYVCAILSKNTIFPYGFFQMFLLLFILPSYPPKKPPCFPMPLPSTHVLLDPSLKLLRPRCHPQSLFFFPGFRSYSRLYSHM